MFYVYKCGDRSRKLRNVNRFYRKKDKITYSVILPTYNEEKNIPRMIKEISKNLRRVSYEIIIVDDNSNDKTPEIIDSYKSTRIVALHRYGTRGILSAINDGMKIAKGKFIIMMDADFSHPPKKIFEMLKYCSKYDLVNCSRFAKGGGMNAPFLQKYSTILFNFIIRLIFLDIGLTDYTGGFHVIKKNKFQDLKFEYRYYWGEFDLELLYSSYRKRFKIKEISYVYKYREEGKSKSQSYIKYAYIYWKMALKLRFR